MALLRGFSCSVAFQGFHAPPQVRCVVRCSSSSFAADADAAFPQQDLERTKQEKKKVKNILGIDQSALLDPWLLADSDSRFAEYNGIQVHYKIAKDGVSSDSVASVGFPAILLHGFGASVFSWERVLQPLSRLLSAAAVAFDRPGFGLTSRLLPVPQGGENPYSLDFSAAITLAFIDFLKAEKAILIGHSAGCIVAANAYFKAPERIAAIVMIAPAIVAPLMTRKQPLKKTAEQPESDGTKSRFRILKFIMTLFARLRIALLDLWARFLRGVQSMKEISAAFYCRVLATILRSQVALSMIQWIMNNYGEKVVRSAWYDPQKADNYVIQGYTKPLGCRHWDRALLEFVIALVASRNGNKKLVDKLRDISCPVLVLTGDTDRLVPGWNAERLARAFPNSQFHMIKECGHLPHEEKPDEVVRIIKEFIASSI